MRRAVFRVVVVGVILAIGWFFIRPPVVEVSRGDVVMVKHSRPSFGGDDALVSGSLTIDADGCLGLDGQVTVFPFMTRIIDTDPVTIWIFGGPKKLGDLVEGGGGYGYGQIQLWLDRCVPEPGSETPSFNP